MRDLGKCHHFINKIKRLIFTTNYWKVEKLDVLYLTDIGLGTLWIANTDNIKEEIKKVLNTDLECVSCIGVGEKDQNPHMRPRKEIDDILI